MMVWINNHRHPLFDHFFEAVTWAGSLAALLPLPMLVLGFLLYRGKAADAWMLGVGFGGAVLLTHLLKMVFGRPRPSLSPVLVSMPTDFSLCETSFSEPGIKDISAAAVGIGIVLGGRLPWWKLCACGACLRRYKPCRQTVQFSQYFKHKQRPAAALFANHTVFIIAVMRCRWFGPPPDDVIPPPGPGPDSGVPPASPDRTVQPGCRHRPPAGKRCRFRRRPRGSWRC